MLNQRKAGLKIRPEEVAEKPPELIKYEQMKVTGLPIWAGGLQDQPHIWLLMMGVIHNTLTIFEVIDRASSGQEN